MTASRHVRPKILQVGLDWFDEKPGGLSRYYLEALRATKERFDNRGLVVGSEDVARMSQGVVRAFASPTDSFVRRLTASRAAIRAELKSFCPDVVVSHFAPHVVSSLDLLRGRPLVTHFHGPWAEESRAEGATTGAARLKFTIERAVYSRSSSIIVLSESFKQLLASRYGVPRERIHVVPGGVNAAEFRVEQSREEAKDRLGLRPDRDYVFCIRRLVRRMGVENLIDAMAQLKQAHPGVVLLVGGRGPLADELRKRAEGLGDSIRFLGGVPQDELPLYYRASLFSVVPSVALEGFGLTTLESLAAGTPVLTTPVGGLQEIMARFRPGLVADGIGTEHLAALLDRVLRNREELPSQQECESFAAENDWKVIGARLGDLYEQAAADSLDERSPSLVSSPITLPPGQRSDGRRMPSLSVVIVSYRRTADLERCVEALARQNDPPDDINIIYREEDEDTVRLIERFRRRPAIPLRAHAVDRPGVVAARNRGLDTTTADVVAMIDDDTEPPPQWAGALRRHYAENPRLGALGGRDIVSVDGTSIDGRRDTVGKLQWFGRVVGNHHLGYGEPRPVDVLKGANMSFRMAAVQQRRFNELLRGDGAQPWEDAEFSLAIKRSGWPVLYDPNLVVRHNQSARREARHYATFAALAGRERYNYRCFCFNEVIAVWPSLSPGGKVAYLVFSGVVGTGVAPGLVQIVRNARSLGFSAVDRFLLCQAGKFQAFMALASSSVASTGSGKTHG